MEPDVGAHIERLRLQPIPGEGGWFRQTWRSPDLVVGKPAGTAIIALFCDDGEGFSAMHRLPSTEVWHFYDGAVFELLLLHPDGSSSDVRLGRDLDHGQQVQVVVPPWTWMGGRVESGGAFSLVGCTMAPGFVQGDVEVGGREALERAYPARAQLIASLTRS